MDSIYDYINNEISIKKELLEFFNINEKLIIFDIGACEGEDSIRYSNLFPNSRVFAFEPNPNNIELTKQNFIRYNKNNIQLIEEALSDTVGKTTFYVSSGSPKNFENNQDWNFGNKSSSLLPPQKVKDVHNWLEFASQIDVKTNTINNFCSLNDIDVIDFVHMDVQGAELKVLKGASKFLEKIKVIWLEVSTIELYKNQALKKDIEKFMFKNNFYLLKNELEGYSGDQLYVNTKYFNKKEASISRSKKSVPRLLNHKLFNSRYKNLFVRKSYAQSGEDVIVKYIFDTIGIEHPNYIDIGAHHPLHINNTSIFYETGSTGINIEPNPDNFQLFKKFRKNDVNLNIGLGLQEGVLDYYKLSSSTLNTFSKEEAERYHNETKHKIIETIKIRVDTINNILNKYNDGIFPDFLTIDVEGLDEEILKCIDYEINSPTVICVETISFSENGQGIKNQPLIEFIKNKGYLVYADTYINTIFVKREKWERI